MTQQDRNFDDLAQRFARNVYGGPKGEIRLAIVWQHLCHCLPQLTPPSPLRILDAGCGFGQLALRLAELGHELVLTDLSQNMLAEAQRRFVDEGAESGATFIQAPVQSLDPQSLGRFDVVLFHAVLEWLAQPRQTLSRLLDLVRPGGHVSLLFYNRDALVFRNLIRGNWRKVESGALQGEAGGLTPYHPLSLREVEAWLEAEGLQIVARAGVRVIYDYLEKGLRERRPIDEIVRMELQYAQQEPYLHLGRYIHVLARKPQ